ncbi:MAG: SapC family protein, partial [Aquificaceae bacterium]|nr:SapC family protein [Aquificaceae bacterium]
SLSRYFPIQFPLIKYQENQEPQFELNIFFKLEQDPKPCVYLKEPEGCQLKDQKPLACKQYPFQVVKDNLGRNVLQIDLSCPGWSQNSKPVKALEEESVANLQDPPEESCRVFENGGLNEYFKKGFVDHSLNFMNSASETRAFVDTLKIHNLIIGGEYRYRGINVPINFVSEERLLNLPKETLQEFRLKGYMQVIYAHLASLQNYQKLIDAYLDRNPEVNVKTDSQTVFVL